MKYKIETKTIDEYNLIYTNKDDEEVKKPFKRNIKLMARIDKVNLLGRIKLSKYLTENNLTKKDFVITTKDKNGNTKYDESNYINLENSFINQELTETFYEVIKDSFGVSIEDLLKDMGVDLNSQDEEVQNQITIFVQEILSLILGINKNDGAPYPRDTKKS